MSTLTQEALVKAAMQYQDALLTYAFGMLKDWSLAEDVFQDTLVLVMKKWKDFRPGTNLYAWVREVTHLKTLELLRKRSRETTTEDVRLQSIVDKTFETHLDNAGAERQRALMAALQDCLAGLNSRSLGLLKDFYWGAKSYRELAQAHRMGMEAVRKALYRLRGLLLDCATRRMKEMEA